LPEEVYASFFLFSVAHPCLLCNIFYAFISLLLCKKRRFFKAPALPHEGRQNSRLRSPLSEKANGLLGQTKAAPGKSRGQLTLVYMILSTEEPVKGSPLWKQALAPYSLSVRMP
jgi:hypothetical protein